MNQRDLSSRVLSCATTLFACAIVLVSAAQAQLNVYVARRGQTDWNKEGRIQGGTDNPLNATGREKAATLARALAEVKIDAVYSSSHQRAQQTASVFEGRAPITKMDELRERFFGKFEGASDKDTTIVADWNKRRYT
jgi:2,3-bisphosphoglycerate-dependent phosphoglycerate mutase